MTRPIPELLLERFRLNELPAATFAAVAREAAADPVVRARLDLLVRSDDEIRDRYEGMLVRRVPPRRRRMRGLVLAGALAAAVVALITTIPNTIVPAAPDSDTRIKGGAARPALTVYRRTSTGSERLADGDVAHAGDLLRLGYASAGRAYGVILSIDGRGAVTLHLPPSGDVAASLAPGGVLLDSAYELDEAPRIERFYFVTSARPFPVAPVLDAARHAGGAPAVLALPAGLEQATFAVQKEVRR